MVFQFHSRFNAAYHSFDDKKELRATKYLKTGENLEQIEKFIQERRLAVRELSNKVEIDILIFKENF